MALWARRRPVSLCLLHVRVSARHPRNCHKNSDFVQANGLIKLGVEKIPNIVTRGVLLDMAAHYGTDLVPEGTAFNRKEID